MDDYDNAIAEHKEAIKSYKRGVIEVIRLSFRQIRVRKLLIKQLKTAKRLQRLKLPTYIHVVHQSRTQRVEVNVK